MNVANPGEALVSGEGGKCQRHALSAPMQIDNFPSAEREG